MVSISGDYSEIGKWLQKAKRCYENYAMRINEEVWKELLSEKVCHKPELKEVLSLKFFEYICRCCVIPPRIWTMFYKAFDWKSKRELLCQIAPEFHVDELLNASETGVVIDYYSVEVGPDVSWEQVDEWIGEYLQVYSDYRSHQFESFVKALKILEKYNINYYKLPPKQVFYLAKVGRLQEAIQLAEAHIEKEKREPDSERAIGACARVGEAFMFAGYEEEAFKYFDVCLEVKALINRKPYLRAMYYTLEYFIEHPEKIIGAEERLRKILPHVRGKKEAEYKEKIYRPLIAYYEKYRNLKQMENKLKLVDYYYDIKEIEKCKTLCKAIIAEDPTYEIAYTYLKNIANREGNREEALTYVMKWFEHSQGERRIRACVEVGDYYIRLQKYEEALKFYNNILLDYRQNEKDKIVVYRRRLNCLEHAKKYKEMASQAQYLLDKGIGEAPELYGYLARACYELGESDRALKACEKGHDPNDYDERTYTLHAKILYERKRYKEVLEVVRAAEEDGWVEDEDFVYYQVASLMALKRYEEAKEICENQQEEYGMTEPLSRCYKEINEIIVKNQNISSQVQNSGQQVNKERWY